MEETTTREKILKSIRNALIETAPNPFPDVELESSVYSDVDDPPDINFAKEFGKVAGKFVYCENETDMAEKLKYLIKKNNFQNVFCFNEKLLRLFKKNRLLVYSNPDKIIETKVGITTCEYLVSRLGSVVVSSKQASGRRLNVFPEIHIVIAYTSQLVHDLKDALNGLKEKYKNNFPSLISVITGPSRTADIEKTLVMGAHGPKDLYVLLVEDG